MTPLVGRAVLIVALATTASVAHGKTDEQVSTAAKEQAKQHFTRGRQLYNVQLYDDAIKAFREAYLAYPNPVFLYNMGQAYRLAGYREQALTAYERYLAESPNAPDRAEVEKIIAELRLDLKRRPSPPRPLPAWQELPPVPASQPPPTGQLLPTGQSTTQQGPSGGKATLPTSPPRPPKSPLWKGSTAMIVGGAVLAGAGAGLLIWGRAETNRYNDAYDRCFPSGSTQPCTDPALLDPLRRLPDRIEALVIAGSIGVGVGAVTAGVGGWLLSRSRLAEQKKLTLVPGWLPGGASVGLAGVW